MLWSCCPARCTSNRMIPHLWPSWWRAASWALLNSRESFSWCMKYRLRNDHYSITLKIGGNNNQWTLNSLNTWESVLTKSSTSSSTNLMHSLPKLTWRARLRCSTIVQNSIISPIFPSTKRDRWLLSSRCATSAGARAYHKTSSEIAESAGK